MKIAFICVHNSCRSQMAEALCKKMATELGLNLEIYSAGSDISKEINPKAIKILKQKYALDISSYKAKGFDSLPKDLDIVVGMGCGVACPSVGARYHFDFGLEDPSGFEDEDFIKVVESLELKLKELLEKIIQGKL
ncbi:arsenate reductase ArsC [Campylobacter lari]|uniref:arsenate reductase/protein-tyrosine-phosphatase family protein n=1 Tax=Campylobacter lari TaxID=201 RepID=UPI001287DA02|nr:arsenate reductase ArsC [Campylobacter lari]ECK1948416.1 arsenate reductase ArsC [Campylobacter lari]MBT0818541.1 arsenate reductase ArsC [Campylobacter lari]MBT0832325.1 arsenate reductase ArsC [Campylobacter lari]MCR6525556.1 arsenate reductase ArsC [Campylobacter lari]